jgi:hypothetical protein
MDPLESTTTLKICTAGGTLLSMAPNISSVDILQTIILAIVGTVVSFFVTLLIKWLTKSKE